MLQKLNKEIAAEALDVAKKLHLEYSATDYSCSLISPELGLTIKINSNPAYERKCIGYYSTRGIEHFDCDHPMVQFMINNHKKEYCDIIYYSEPIDFPEDKITFLNWVESLLDENKLKEIWFPIEKKYIESMVKYLGKNYVKNYEYDINWIQETYGAEWTASVFKAKNKKAKKVSVKVEPDDWNDIYNSILDDILDEAGQDYEDVDSDNLYNDIAMIMENFEYEGKVDEDGDPEDWNDFHNAISDFIHTSINTSDYLPKHAGDEEFDESTKSSKKSLKESRGNVSFSGGFLANVVYVGDLCYCLNDAVYQEAIELANYEGKFDSTISGMHVEGAFVSTQYGDGGYPGSDGRTYGVDAGIIGIVNITSAAATEGEKFEFFSKDGVGRVIKLPKYGPIQYEISRDEEGTITVEIKQGKFKEVISIQTGESEEEEEEDEYTEICPCCGREYDGYECICGYPESYEEDDEEEEFEESVINEAKSDSAFLKKAAKIAKVKIADIEYFNNKSDWMVVLDSEDSYDADYFRNAVDNLLTADSGEHSYDDVEGLEDIHLGTAEYYEVSEDEYSDLDPDWRDKVVVYCEPSKRYKTRREIDW